MASTYLSWTPSNTGTRNTFTWSFWVKRAKLGSYQKIHDANYNNDSNYYCSLSFKDDDKINMSNIDAGSTNINWSTTRKFKDTNAWYHIVVTFDTTNGTANDRIRCYVNGERETLTGTFAVAQGTDNTFWNRSGNKNWIGAKSVSASDYLDACLSHFHFIDGTAYDASAFGETDTTTGEWKAKTSPSVTYGTNGFLIFKDGNTITDQSSNSNDFTLGGGTLTDLKDNPDNTFATFNPLFKSNSLPTGGLSNGNNTAKTNGADSTWRSAFSSIATPPSGKYYFEVKWSSGSHFIMGAASAPTLSKNNFKDLTDASYSGQYICLYGSNWYSNGSNQSTYQSGISLASGVIGMMALDRDNNKIWFGVNGSWGGSQNPATNTGGQSLPGDLDEFWNFGISSYSNSGTGEYQANFGNGYFGTTAVSSAGTNASENGIFEYDVPTGYTALSTKGLNL